MGRPRCPRPRVGWRILRSGLRIEPEEVAAPGGGAPYSIFTKDGKRAAGMGQLTRDQQDAGIPAAWSSYIAVDDVDDVAEKAGALGAQIVMAPTKIMDAGRMAFVTDPTGAAIGFWQAGQHQGTDAFDDPGFMTWNELATSDVDRAKQFYTDLFGWGAETQAFEGGFEYTTFSVDQRAYSGTYDMSGIVPDGTPPHWSVYFSVDDTDAAVERARDRGATILREPSDTEFGRMAVIADPQGAVFQIIALA